MPSLLCTANRLFAAKTRQNAASDRGKKLLSNIDS